MLCRMRPSFVVVDAVAVAVAAAVQLCICPFRVAVACLIATKNSKKAGERSVAGGAKQEETRRNKWKKTKHKQIKNCACEFCELCQKHKRHEAEGTAEGRQKKSDEIEERLAYTLCIGVEMKA